ncbi:MAG: hypothetical protein ACRCX8_12705 [Sarcina sp.]
MLKTKYKLNNKTSYVKDIEIRLLANRAEAKLIINGLPIRVDIVKNFEYSIPPHTDLEIHVNTIDAYLVVNPSCPLVSIEGPIERCESLDRYFKGVTSLEYVSFDVFIKNTHIDKLVETFRDCICFSPKDTNFLMPLTKLNYLEKTFTNTAVSFINKPFLGGLENREPKTLISTFSFCEDIGSISIDAFENINAVKMISTFDNCKYLKSIRPEMFSHMVENAYLDRTFSNTGIEKLDANLNSFIPENMAVKDIFLGCDNLKNKINEFK